MKLFFHPSVAASSFCPMTTSVINNLVGSGVFFFYFHVVTNKQDSKTWNMISEGPGSGLSDMCSCPSQVAVTIGLQYVDSSLSTLANPEDPESESEGWILEKTVKETFTDIMSKMKAMGKGTKVEEGGETAVATVSWANPSCKNWHHSHLRRRGRGCVRFTTFFYQHLLRRHYLHTHTHIFGYGLLNGLLTNGLLASIFLNCTCIYIERAIMGRMSYVMVFHFWSISGSNFASQHTLKEIYWFGFPTLCRFGSLLFAKKCKLISQVNVICIDKCNPPLMEASPRNRVFYFC